MRRARPVRRVLVLPQEIAGVASGLVRGIRASGLEADLLVRGRHPFGYPRPAPGTPVLGRLQSLLTRLSGARGPVRPMALAMSLVLRVALLPWLLRRYDALVYLGPTTLTGLAGERRLAKRLGLVVVTVFLGSDARPPYLSGYVIRPGQGEPDLADIRRQVRATVRRVRAAETGSTWVVNHPPTAGFLRRLYVDFSTMGLPAPETGAPRTTGADAAVGPFDRTVRVVHAPSMAPWKGTDQIRAAVNRLRDEGLRIDYVELVGVPHDQVVATLAGADLVVDELYSDAILAGLATEAAALGATPLVFGYAGAALASTAESLGVGLRHYHPPEQLLDILRDFVSDADLRISTGSAVHDFVVREWSAAAVGARYARLLTEGPDPSWLRDPAAADYVDGWGVEREERRTFLRRFLAAGDPADLGLPDGSALREALLLEAGDGLRRGSPR